jgi:peptide/nickel transport system substrate-binding protein
MEEFSEKVLGGIQAPILGPLMPASWAYDPEIREPGQDLEKAQEVLAATTIPAGTTLKIKTNAGNTTREQMATYAQAQLAKIGITAEVEFQEWSTFFGDVIDGNFDMIVLTSNAGIPDPDTLHTDYHTDGARNYGKYSNPEVDRLLEEARGTMDVDQRKELYKQAQELLVQDLPRIWAYEYLYSIATRSNITNVRPSALGPMWDAKYWHKN